MRALIPLLATALVSAGCFATTGLPIHDALAGSVRVETPSAPAVTITPARCESGEREVFLGADFFAANGKVVRLIVAPTGAPTLRIFDAAHALEAGTIFRRSDCSRFELALDRTGWRVNDVYDISVRLAFECRMASGEHATGELSAEHCH